MNLGFDILYDSGKDLCFVGDTYHNEILARYFSATRVVQHLRFEQVLDQPDSWIDKHQFMCAVSNVKFKQSVVEVISSRGGAFFSAISKSSMIGHRVAVGKNTLINHFNSIYDDTYIGDHCTLTNFLSISHEVRINDYCHISPYTYLCFCEVKQGCYVGMRSSVFGYPESPITIPEYTNLLADSRLMKSLETSGTYSGRRMVDPKTSLELHL